MYSQKSKLAIRSVVITVLLALLLLGLGLYFLMFDENSVFESYVLLGLLAAIFLCSLYFCPREINIDANNLNIVFPLRVKRVSLEEISKIEPYKVTMNFVRTFGSGGFFGWWGWFRNQELGKFMVYASELDHVFLVEIKSGKKYVVSCSDPETMCDEVRKVAVAKNSEK